MLSLSNGAGVIADISYSVPDTIGYGISYYWEFKIWGSKGMFCFSASTDGVKLYKKRRKRGFEYFTDFETDDNSLEAFIDEVLGKKSSFLSGDEVFNSSEATLLIQKKADSAF